MRRALAIAVFLGAGAAAAEAPRRVNPCARGAKYRGPKIDVDLKDADLHNAFRLLARVGDANIVVADDVKGKITIRVEGVPWEQVMCAVTRSKKLNLWREDTIYFVTARDE
jgi:type IV pilus assembly protein PilQ